MQNKHPSITEVFLHSISHSRAKLPHNELLAGRIPGEVIVSNAKPQSAQHIHCCKEPRQDTSPENTTHDEEETK